MSGWLIIFTGLIYLGIAIEQFIKGGNAMGITYAGYAFANVGLFMMASR